MADRTGVRSALLVVVVCAAIAYLGWLPLSIPVRMLKGVMPSANCSNLEAGTPAMYICSIQVALVSLIVPCMLMAAMFVARKAIAAAVMAAMRKLPRESGFLVAPIIATVAFTLSWAAMHLETSYASGLVPQRAFPAVIGLFTYCTVRYGAHVQRALRGFFDIRDRVPTPLRFVLIFFVPAIMALVLTFTERATWITYTAHKEQVIVLVSLVFGFALLAPRQGDLAQGVGSLVHRPGGETAG